MMYEDDTVGDMVRTTHEPVSSSYGIGATMSVVVFILLLAAVVYLFEYRSVEEGVPPLHVTTATTACVSPYGGDPGLMALGLLYDNRYAKLSDQDVAAKGWPRGRQANSHHRASSGWLLLPPDSTLHATAKQRLVSQLLRPRRRRHTARTCTNRAWPRRTRY